MKYFSYILLLFLSSLGLFSQEYEIAWEKVIGGSYAEFSKDGEFIYVAKGLEIWKYRSIDGSFVSKFDNGDLKVSSDQIYFGIMISNDGNYILTRIDGGVIALYSTLTEKFLKLFNFGGSSDISNDGHFIITARYDATLITVFDIEQNKFIKEIPYNLMNKKLKISHNGKMFATASETSSGICFLTLWDTETLTEIKRFDIEGGHTTTFYEIKFSWDDKFVGISTFNPYNAIIFDTQTLSLYTSSKTINKEFSSAFAFLSNKFIFAFNDYTNMIYNVFLVNNSNFVTEQNFPLISEGIISSSNGYIFTKHSLLRPKTVGVIENMQNRLLISPNPASDYIEINVGVRLALPLLESFEIYNVFGEKNPTLALPIGEGTGKVLPNGEDLGGVFKIDISNLTPGVYFIKIGDKFEKFVKM